MHEQIVPVDLGPFVPSVSMVRSTTHLGYALPAMRWTVAPGTRQATTPEGFASCRLKRLKLCVPNRTIALLLVRQILTYFGIDWTPQRRPTFALSDGHNLL